MALHNPVLEAAARIHHALKRADYCDIIFARHWCANHKEQALAAVEVAASQIDYLRTHNLLAPPIPATARPQSEWHEDMGDVLWWEFPVTESPYVGTPLDLGYTVELELHTQAGCNPRISATGQIGGWPGYHTHFTPLPAAPANPDKDTPQ